jgi:hypothetical protein
MATARWFIASVAKDKPCAHFIAMAERVVHSASIPHHLLPHQVLSFLNKTQHQWHHAEVTINNAIERIQQQMLAWIQFPHQQRILPK